VAGASPFAPAAAFASSLKGTPLTDDGGEHLFAGFRKGFA
jgi:hypothetical protein